MIGAWSCGDTSNLRTNDGGSGPECSHCERSSRQDDRAGGAQASQASARRICPASRIRRNSACLGVGTCSLQPHVSKAARASIQHRGIRSHRQSVKFSSRILLINLSPTTLKDVGCEHYLAGRSGSRDLAGRQGFEPRQRGPVPRSSRPGAIPLRPDRSTEEIRAL